MQRFTSTAPGTSEQHKEVTFSLMERDRSDMPRLVHKLEEHEPFSERKALRNIVTGINADKDVNVQYLFNVGKDAVVQMKCQDVFSYTYR